MKDQFVSVRNRTLPTGRRCRNGGTLQTFINTTNHVKTSDAQPPRKQLAGLRRLLRRVRAQKVLQR